MTTKSLAYDAAAYHVPVIYSGDSGAGTNTTTEKFAAFTAQKLKAVTIAVQTVGTSSMQPLLYKKSATTTSTTTLSALSQAQGTTGGSVSNTPVDVSLIQGDQFWVTHGTDNTIVASIAIESYVIPGAILEV